MNLELIPSAAAYAELFQQWRNEPTAVKFNPLKQVEISELREKLAKCRSDLADLREGEQYRWFVRLNGDLIGQVALSNASLMMGTAEIGYMIGEKYHGLGICTEAMRRFLDMVFRETQLRRLTAFVHEGNIASCRVLEKLGFVREGLLREHYLVNGTAVNEVVFGLLRSEWGIMGGL